MTLRRRSKAIENLRLANIRDLAIPEDDSDLCSPCSLGFVRSDLLPGRVDGENTENIAIAFKNFAWIRPKIDGTVLYDYRRFTNDMKVPTATTIEPWVEWLQTQFGWDRKWMLENPVATKREVMRRFEVSEERKKKFVVVKRPNRCVENRNFEVWQVQGRDSQESMERLRGGAVSRFGFRDEESDEMLVSKSKREASKADQSEPLDLSPTSIQSDEDDRVSAILVTRKVTTARAASASGFRQMKALRVGLSSLKKKALTNPWQTRQRP